MNIFKMFGMKKGRPSPTTNYPGFNAPGMGMEPDDPTSRPSTKWDTGRRREGPTAPGQNWSMTRRGGENWRNVMAGRGGSTRPGGFYQRTDKYERAKGFPQSNPKQQKWDWRDAKEWAGQVTSKDPAEQAKARPGRGAYEAGVGPDPQITPSTYGAPKAKVKQYAIPDYGPQG